MSDMPDLSSLEVTGDHTSKIEVAPDDWAPGGVVHHLIGIKIPVPAGLWDDFRPTRLVAARDGTIKREELRTSLRDLMPVITTRRYRIDYMLPVREQAELELQRANLLRRVRLWGRR